MIDPYPYPISLGSDLCAQARRLYVRDSTRLNHPHHDCDVVQKVDRVYVVLSHDQRPLVAYRIVDKHHPRLERISASEYDELLIVMRVAVHMANRHVEEALNDPGHPEHATFVQQIRDGKTMSLTRSVRWAHTRSVDEWNVAFRAAGEEDRKLSGAWKLVEKD